MSGPRRARHGPQPREPDGERVVFRLGFPHGRRGRGGAPYWWVEVEGGVLAMLPALVEEWLALGPEGEPVPPYSWALTPAPGGELEVDTAWLAFMWGGDWRTWPAVRSDVMAHAGVWTERDRAGRRQELVG